MTTHFPCREGVVYDAVVIWLRGVDTEHIPARLRDCTTHTRNGCQRFTGRIGNLRVMVDGRDIRIEGSIPHFLRGENLTTASRAEAKEFIDMLSDLLGLSFDNATVSQLEIGTTLGLACPVSSYLPFLLSAPGLHGGYNDYRQGGQVLFRNSQELIRLYDKDAEMKRTGPIDGLYWMRAEVRLIKRLKGTFRREIVTAADLWDVQFHREAVELWRRSLLSLEHARLIVPPSDVTLDTWTDITNYCTATLCSYMGDHTAAFEMILRSRHAAEWNVRKTGGFRLRMKKLARDTRITYDDERMAELDARINEAADSYLAM